VFRTALSTLFVMMILDLHHVEFQTSCLSIFFLFFSLSCGALVDTEYFFCYFDFGTLGSSFLPLCFRSAFLKDLSFFHQLLHFVREPLVPVVSIISLVPLFFVPLIVLSFLPHINHTQYPVVPVLTLDGQVRSLDDLCDVVYPPRTLILPGAISLPF